MSLAGGLMWGSMGLIGWTHVGYPLALGVLGARRLEDAPRDPGEWPRVALIVAAHDEEAVVAARLENALALDYPSDRLEVVLALDGSTDATAAIAGGYERVRVLENERGGKVAAQNAAVRAVDAEVVAFSDANSMWDHAALKALVRRLADPEVGYVCGRLVLVDPGSGTNQEGLYWRYELWQRAQESRLGSITAGNGAIYAVRRSAFRELGAGQSHDIGLPFRLRQDGLRAVYEPGATATEEAPPTSADEWPRKVRMLRRAWQDVLRGGMLDPRRVPAGYWVALVSHRLLRYATGVLHVAAVAAALPGARSSRGPRGVLALHAAWLGLAAEGRRARPQVPLAPLAWYYLVVTAASAAGLVAFLRHGPQSTWEATR